MDWFKNRLVTKEDKDNAVNETKIDAIIISLGKLNTKIDELKADMQIQDNGLGTRITEQGKILNERIDQVETKLTQRIDQVENSLIQEIQIVDKNVNKSNANIAIIINVMNQDPRRKSPLQMIN
ncbi:hypothetical protein HC864_02545 [Candidatus Gracilibacteria bacterium]|nr:hypothetical protein [Candidatus Gracilibacteria bacterium]